MEVSTNMLAGLIILAALAFLFAVHRGFRGMIVTPG